MEWMETVRRRARWWMEVLWSARMRKDLMLARAGEVDAYPFFSALGMPLKLGYGE